MLDTDVIEYLKYKGHIPADSECKVNFNTLHYKPMIGDYYMKTRRHDRNHLILAENINEEAPRQMIKLIKDINPEAKVVEFDITESFNDTKLNEEETRIQVVSCKLTETVVKDSKDPPKFLNDKGQIDAKVDAFVLPIITNYGLQKGLMYSLKKKGFKAKFGMFK